MKEQRNNWGIGMFMLLAILLTPIGNAIAQHVVSDDLVTALEEKISHHKESTGNKRAVKVWTRMLDAIQNGGRSLAKTFKEAQLRANSNYDDDAALWKEVVGALELNLHLTLYSHSYDVDWMIIKVITNKINHYHAKQKIKKGAGWIAILEELYNDNIEEAIARLKNVKESDRPDEWESMIDSLEGYEERFVADVHAVDGYNYNIYDLETGAKLASVAASANSKQGSAGTYGTLAGKTHWEVQFAGTEGSSNYLSYGYWARSLKPDGNKDYNEKRSAVFYHGDNPATDISSVTGAAIYTGNSVGVWQYNTTKNSNINRFTGSATLTAHFGDGRISGYIDNLSDSSLPSRINLESTSMGSDGAFGGRSSASDGNRDIVGYGSWEGRFYNHNNPQEAPGQVGGSFFISTGQTSTDQQIQGSFGADMSGHDPDHE